MGIPKRQISIRYYKDAEGHRRARYFWNMQWRPIKARLADVLIANKDAKIDKASENLFHPPILEDA